MFWSFTHLKLQPYRPGRQWINQHCIWRWLSTFVFHLLISNVHTAWIIKSNRYQRELLKTNFRLWIFEMILFAMRIALFSRIMFIAAITWENVLILNVWGPSYLGWTRSILWLLMPWLLASPGHQQPWYWLCNIGKSWSYTRNDFNFLWHVSVEEWHKM